MNRARKLCCVTSTQPHNCHGYSIPCAFTKLCFATATTTSQMPQLAHYTTNARPNLVSRLCTSNLVSHALIGQRISTITATRRML